MKTFQFLSSAIGSVDLNDYFIIECSPTGLELAVSKCLLNKSNFFLSNLVINSQPGDLESPDNNCLGELQYANGPQYVFKIQNSFSDCNTVVTHNNTHIVYENAIQGKVGSGSNSIISRSVRLSSFERLT